MWLFAGGGRERASGTRGRSPSRGRVPALSPPLSEVPRQTSSHYTVLLEPLDASTLAESPPATASFWQAHAHVQALLARQPSPDTSSATWSGSCHAANALPDVQRERDIVESVAAERAATAAERTEFAELKVQAQVLRDTREAERQRQREALDFHAWATEQAAKSKHAPLSAQLRNRHECLATGAGEEVVETACHLYGVEAADKVYNFVRAYARLMRHGDLSDWSVRLALLQHEGQRGVQESALVAFSRALDRLHSVEGHSEADILEALELFAGSIGDAERFLDARRKLLEMDFADLAVREALLLAGNDPDKALHSLLSLSHSH